jgi:hypothetical protein
MCVTVLSQIGLFVRIMRAYAENNLIQINKGCNQGNDVCRRRTCHKTSAGRKKKLAQCQLQVLGYSGIGVLTLHFADSTY